ncbi:aminoacyl-tRNA synthetase [Lithospermum erythrorhizon]|uniref:Aminoacyl-tRNA synthetase n=1 Tax=Lithospermum erythrorhizon TaxID=34254 RepID=A0AAV3QXH5_LITER
MFRVLQRVNHPGGLDKSSPNAGYVLLMFYHLYEGKNRREFETELIERFGSIVKMPLLQSSRPRFPDSVKNVIEEGISLYNLHTRKHGRLESTKGTYAKEWAKWEKQLRETLHGNSEHLNSIQVPFESAVSSVLEQLKAIAKGEYSTPSSERRKFGAIVYAAVTLPVSEIHGLLYALAEKHPQIDALMEGKDMENSLKNSHVTLAHKRSHGVAAVASYGSYLHQNVPVDMTAFLFTDKLAALDVRLGSIDGEQITSRNEWPHVTLWTASGVKAQEANTLPQLLSEGKATRMEIDPPVRLTGTLEFF